MGRFAVALYSWTIVMPSVPLVHNPACSLAPQDHNCTNRASEPPTSTFPLITIFRLSLSLSVFLSLEMGSYSFDGVFDLDEALSMPMPVNSTPTATTLTDPMAAVVDPAHFTTTFPVVATANDAVCSVCTEKFDNGGRRILCGHVFHDRCIATWLSVRNTCPLCRVVVVDPKQAHLIKSTRWSN